MTRIKCNQCGAVIIASKAKKCPKCGDTLKDEVKQKICHKIRAKPKTVVTILIIVSIGLATCLAAEFSSRMYSWKEKKTEEVIAVDTHTYTYTERHEYPSFDDDSPPMYYYDTHTDTDYYLYLNESGKREVDDNTYYRTNVGDNYTYYITHWDWKPGMKDVPIPMWVWIIPLGILITFVVVIFWRNHILRVSEMNEWIETGDLDVGEEE